jgi:hypothetical protein
MRLLKPGAGIDQPTGKRPGHSTSCNQSRVNRLGSILIRTSLLAPYSRLGRAQVNLASCGLFCGTVYAF